MAEIRNGVFEVNETNSKSNGGTERLTRELSEQIDTDFLSNFQIVSSRVRELQDDKIRVFWAHDLPGDPESEFLLDPKNHSLFHIYVFVSNWQMQRYIERYRLPWGACRVIPNAIKPLEFKQHTKEDLKTPRFIYTPTPHRGLNILYSVFDLLSKDFDIHLDVYSSFELYGWKQRDLEYQELFDMIKNHSRMTYHGTQPYDVVRNAVSNSHIFAYPSTWQETSCLCLIEAMSAGLLCIHSNYGALYETAGFYNLVYQYIGNPNAHAAELYGHLKLNLNKLSNITDDHLFAYNEARRTGSIMTNRIHGWESVREQWLSLLQALYDEFK